MTAITLAPPPMPPAANVWTRARPVSVASVLVALGVGTTPVDDDDVADLAAALQSRYQAVNEFWAAPLRGQPTVAVTAVPSSPSDRIVAFKETSELTWDQIARLFGVSKRAVLHWRNGAGMAAGHEETLTALLGILRSAPQDVESVKDWLMTIDPETGRAPYQDMMAVQAVPTTPWIDRQPTNT